LKFSVAKKEKATERRGSSSSGITGQNCYFKIITSLVTSQSFPNPLAIAHARGAQTISRRFSI
jgi:hypothetical protein